jgi:DNA (cytosine-5)-methyltransferase 1
MKGEPIKQIIDDFSSVGYEVKYQLIKSEEYGIPQTRWRVIIFGVRLDKVHSLPDSWNIIDQNKEVNDDDISRILRNKEFFLVRKFLNDLMSEDKWQKQQNISVEYEEAITNCCYC